MGEACLCDEDSACEGSECVHGAWLRCAVGCWAVSDMAGWCGWTLIWLLVGLGTEETQAGSVLTEQQT